MRSILIPVGIVLTLSTSAFADRCSFQEHGEAKSANGRYLFRMDWAEEWKGRLEDTKTGNVITANLAGLDHHIHSSAFVTDDGTRIVVFDSSTKNYSGGNLVVYDRELKLLKGFALKDLLTEIDFKAVRYSVSHCWFTGNSKDGKGSSWLSEDGKTFSIFLKSKRTAIVSLAEPKIIPTPDVIPEVFEFEEGLPPGKTDLERFQGKWMLTNGGAGILGTDPDYYTEEPKYYTFDGNKILVPGRKFNNYTFRLDETVTPHAIDLFEPGKKEPFRGIYEFRDGRLLICTPDSPEKPRPKLVEAKGWDVDDWTETMQRRKGTK